MVMKASAKILPREEWPYEVPENWVWTQGKNIFEPMESKKPSEEWFSYIDIDTVDNTRQTVKTPKRIPSAEAPSRASRKLHTGDTIFSLVRPYLRNIAYIDEHLSNCIASTGFYVCHPISALDSKYIYWLLTSDYAVMGLNQHMKGDNSPSIRSGDMENFCFPLAPLPEQQRIVARIASLFAKLDAAAGKIRAALDSFDIRKAAILHKAFTGELTKKWREENGVGMESWEICKMEDVFDLKAGKNINSNKIYDNKTPDHQYPCFGGNGIRGYVDTFNQDGAFPIIGRQGALCGNINLAKGQFYATEHAVVVKFRRDMAVSFAVHCLTFLNLNQYATATAQPGLSVNKILKTPIQYVPFPEQKEIVRILDAIFARERAAKETAERLLEKIALTKKSILARAFRGALGTNDPTEESAEKALLA